MKNNYIIIGVVIAIAAIVFVVSAKKSAAPADLAADTATSTFLVSGVYDVDAENSVIRWRGEYINGVGEEGTLKLSSGQVILADGVIANGNFEIDMNSIEKDVAGNVMLINYLKSKDFFNVEEYPTASFVFKKAEFPREDWRETGKYVVAGDLTLKGVTKPIALPVALANIDGELHASSTFAMNRTEWGVNYNSPSIFEDLGNMAIRDAILIELDLVARKVE